jgi:hypothetical protein
VLKSLTREELPLQEAGPAILWYSWLFGATAISAAAALVVPRSIAERIGQAWVWGVPAALLVVILVYERRWFY